MTDVERRFLRLLEVAQLQLATEQSPELASAEEEYKAACRGMVAASSAADPFTKARALAEMERASLHLQGVIETLRTARLDGDPL